MRPPTACGSRSCTGTWRWVRRRPCPSGNVSQWEGSPRRRLTEQTSCGLATYLPPPATWHACPLAAAALINTRALLQGVYVPRMHTELTTRKVLVMEWVEGQRLRTAFSAAQASSVQGTLDGVSRRRPLAALRGWSVGRRPPGVHCSNSSRREACVRGHLRPSRPLAPLWLPAAAAVGQRRRPAPRGGGRALLAGADAGGGLLPRGCEMYTQQRQACWGLAALLLCRLVGVAGLVRHGQPRFAGGAPRPRAHPACLLPAAARHRALPWRRPSPGQPAAHRGRAAGIP